MKIAVIGAGVSGNLVARLLHPEHEVHLLEANDYPGGHTNTVEFQAWGRSWSADTGFMVFNDRTYPFFIKMLNLLGVSWQDSDMSFSVRCEKTGLEYQGSSFNGLFAQRSNLFRPSFYGMLREILRFNRQSLEVLLDDDDRMTMGEYLEKRRFSKPFVDRYLIPMTAAIWSARPRAVLEFPAHFLIGFFRNHGLLQIRDRPMWKTVQGGARHYVSRLLEPLGNRVRLNCPVVNVTRHADDVSVTPQNGPSERFEHVVFATHADQTLGILTDADDREREILGAFPYQYNQAVLHTDNSMLPRRKRAWASWNYHVARETDVPVAVTYDLSRLQRIDSPEPVLLTLNPGGRVDPKKVLRVLDYHHPAYGPASRQAQRRHAEISGQRRTWYCGAYWGYGFHEDGVISALTVARCFGKDLDSCIAASTKDTSDIVASSP
ncbi:MAG: FAD-dependent oxidoreductase [Planctomycetaceae bacterium]|nr:MAG: FAD-dependent oxidoreductase [Planctomycetaceae bacterium]